MALSLDSLSHPHKTNESLVCHRTEENPSQKYGMKYIYIYIYMYTQTVWNMGGRSIGITVVKCGICDIKKKKNGSSSVRS